MNLDALFNPAVLALMIPVLGVLGWIVTILVRHRERIAMIEHGIDPDTRMPVAAAQQPPQMAVRR